MKILFKNKWRLFKSKLLLLIPLIVFIFFLSFNLFYSDNDKYITDNNINVISNERPNHSGYIWARLDLTNPSEVNNTGFPFTHNTEIPIKGKLYNEWIPENKSGCDVAIVIDDVQDSRYTDITDEYGEFQINYTIDPSLNIFSTHKIEVNVTSGIPPNGEVEYLYHYIIEVNATSYFDVDIYNKNSPQLAGGNYKLPGFLNYDNSSGIKNATINYYWYNESLEQWPMNTFKTNIFDGSLKKIPLPPDDNSSKRIYLNLTYSGNSHYINGSQKLISINLYRNITCMWDTVNSATEGNAIIIKGQLFARHNSNLKINYTEVELKFINGPSIGNITTDANGTFNINYQIPQGIIGGNNISVELLNYANVFSNTSHFISISSAPPPPITPAEDIGDDDEESPPPFQNFFIVFIPIIIGVAAALVIFAYFHLRKQKEEAQIVKLPLEDRIRNLKILKETGRLEEALSYLFQSIYIELINAKYGRKKKENETIRDFAIISVRDLKLNPASIYPFIQNIEKIIYDKPFIIKDKDFYASVDLFSPIYFELTGYQFILNF